MYQTSDDSSSPSGKKEYRGRGAGLVCYIVLNPLTENARVRIAPELPSSARKKKRLHDCLT